MPGYSSSSTHKVRGVREVLINLAGRKAGDWFLTYCWLFWEIPLWKLTFVLLFPFLA